MNLAAFTLLAIVMPDREGAPMLEPEGLATILPDAEERRRYLYALRRLAKGPVTPGRLAQRARLDHRAAQVRLALRADPRLERVRVPIRGPERYVLRRDATSTREGASA